MPPPPPPSASYNLKIIDSSDEEDEYVSVNDAYTYNSLPWAEAVPVQQQPVVEATDVCVIDEKKEDSEPSDAGDAGEVAVGKKKKKKSKKKKKKKSKIDKALEEEAAVAPVASAAAPESSSKKKHNKSVSFGTVAIREYARTLGAHTVPSDGAWPLGLGKLAAEHTQEQWLELQKLHDEAANSSPSKHKHSPSQAHHNHPKGWLVSDFESRKQTELQQRYIQLIRDQRRRKFEKQWEKNHVNKFHHSYNTRKGRKRSDSCHGRSSSVRSSSGKLKMEMSAEEKEELERIVAQPVDLPPTEYLETRQFDFKARVKAKSVDESMTEDEELIMNHRGRNPLFTILHENDRKKLLFRDDEWFKQCHVIDDSKQNQLEEEPVDIADQTVTQHIQHDLETLRIHRSDPTNLGCDCRKLHVFLPGASDKTHHKKKGSNRRLPERKVREELRRRGIAQDGMNREKLEKALHDAIESEPCCWGNDCPCFRSGIGCQADTCSCWHPSHEGGGGTGAKKQDNNEARNVIDQDVHDIEQRCGNSNGMYVVNFGKIRRHREQFLGCTDDVKVVAK